MLPGLSLPATPPLTAASAADLTGERRLATARPGLCQLPPSLYEMQLLARLSETAVAQLAQVCGALRAPSQTVLLQRQQALWQQLQDVLQACSQLESDALNVLQALHVANALLPRLLHNAWPSTAFKRQLAQHAPSLAQLLLRWGENIVKQQTSLCSRSSVHPLRCASLNALLALLTCLRPYMTAAQWQRRAMLSLPELHAAVPQPASAEVEPLAAWAAACDKAPSVVTLQAFQRRLAEQLQAYRRTSYGNLAAHMQAVGYQIDAMVQALTAMTAQVAVPQAQLTDAAATAASREALAAWLRHELQQHPHEHYLLQLNFLQLLNGLQTLADPAVPPPAFWGWLTDVLHNGCGAQQLAAALFVLEQPAHFVVYQSLYAAALSPLLQALAAELDETSTGAAQFCYRSFAALQKVVPHVAVSDKESILAILGSGYQKAWLDPCVVSQALAACAPYVALPQQKIIFKLLQEQYGLASLQLHALKNCADVMPAKYHIEVLALACRMLTTALPQHETGEVLAFLSTYCTAARLQCCPWQSDPERVHGLFKQLASVLRALYRLPASRPAEQAERETRRVHILAILASLLCHVRPLAWLAPWRSLLQEIWLQPSSYTNVVYAAPLLAASRAYVKTLSVAACRDLLQRLQPGV